MPLLAILFVVMVTGAVYLFVRYQYTRKSLAALAAAFALAWFLSYLADRALLPTVTGGYLAVASLLTAMPFFVIFALIISETWRKVKQRDYDREVAALRAREAEIRERLVTISDRMAALKDQEATLQARMRQAADSAERLRAAVEEWQQGGGVARVRAIKVRDWQKEFASMDDASLDATVEKIQAQMASLPPEDDRYLQLQAERNVAELERLSRQVQQPRRQQEEKDTKAADLAVERNMLESELLELRGAIYRAEKRRAEYLSGRITL